jgi:hypothetical protein
VKPARAARLRTVAHMQRMLAMGTAVGAVFACGKETKTDGTESRGCGKTKGVDPNASSGGGSSGYAVVDPMPTPAHCPGTAAKITPVVSFESGDGGALDIVLVLSMPADMVDFKYVNDAPAYVYGGKVVSHEVTAKGVKTRIAVEATATNASLSVKTTCNAGPGTIMANIAWAGAPKKGLVPVVSLNEY